MGENLDKAKGTIKENVGDLTDDERLEREGKMDRAGAEVKEKAGDAVDSVKDNVRDASPATTDATRSRPPAPGGHVERPARLRRAGRFSGGRFPPPRPPPPRAEWDPRVLGFRAELERLFEHGLREAVVVEPTPLGPVDLQLRNMIDADRTPSVSSFLAREGTVAMYREFLMHRSAYHLKEADPHTFANPRLRGRVKTAMVGSRPTSTAAVTRSGCMPHSSHARCASSGSASHEGAYIDRGSRG